MSTSTSTNAILQEWRGESRYVFHLPLRIIHWTIFFAVIGLSMTGYWIGSGNLPAGPGGVFQMGWIRYLHTIFGWTLAAALLGRLYLFFFGSEYERWAHFVPHRKKDWHDMKEVFQYYTFLSRRYPHMEFGHNRLASATYLVVYFLLLLMVFSGLALHGIAFSFGWQSWLRWPFHFVTPPELRLFHHMGMYLIWGFVAHHVASAVLVDHEKRGGVLSGIFSGFNIVCMRHKR